MDPVVGLRVVGGTDVVAEQLWEQLGALSVSRDTGGVSAWFGSRAGAEAAAEVVGGVLIEAADDAYLDTWREFARPTRVGRLVVRPAWVAPLDEDATVEIAIDPDHVFGHGGHPSTRLVLSALDARLRGGETVLDVGCGSGVLAIGAVALGASSVVALDIDPAAVATTRTNVLANGMRAHIEVSARPLAAVQRPFDVVVANIGVVVLRELGNPLARRIAPGGWMVLSGLLDHQWEEVVDGLSDECELLEVLEEDGWAAPVLAGAIED